jgi:hypothetical protein
MSKRHTPAATEPIQDALRLLLNLLPAARGATSPTSIRDTPIRKETLNGGRKNAIFPVFAGAPRPLQMHRACFASNFGGANVFKLEAGPVP